VKYRQRLMNFIIPIMTIALAAGPTSFGKTSPLRREVASKPVYETLLDYLNTNQIIFKLKEDVGQSDFDEGKFLMTGTECARPNQLISLQNAVDCCDRDINTLGEQEMMQLLGPPSTSLTKPDYLKFSLP